MPAPPRKTGRQRRRRAKTAVDFATGEVHDRALDAAAQAGADPATRAIAQAEGSADPASAPDAPLSDAFSPEALSNEDRAQLGVDVPRRRGARSASRQTMRVWVKTRKVP